ncbi:MAG: thiaminase II TenA [Roseibaca calidilacus]|uniref:Aminopyrimidine aminohydrolase n=1 Tax=Roseibaca calidilacus TaxID=1666912 RepID=A0A0P7VRP2_9RHOB|nr:thiaminase II [Roseibaca calidilacus]KPP89506.1 MAG: thiaminase II TenA [Roseibaca calidilacus]CUX79384.1 thiaminase (transcriptional activator TenA) [Roseibaca calidilacus]
MSFMTRALAETAPLCAAMRDMPFNRGLADGSLPRAAFQRYIIQDAHYLNGFARALALAAGRAPDAQAVSQLAGFAAGTLQAEHELHAHYMGLFGVTKDDFAATPPSPACDHYTNFLIATSATRSTAESVAAVLPCFWVYRDVGRAIHACAAPDTPYRAWIDTYVSDRFDAAVEACCAVAERLYESAQGTTRDSMCTIFARSTLLEWSFWDSAWHGHAWPDPVAVGQG